VNFLRVQKLGKNHGRYLGETIDIASVLRQIAIAAEHNGWTAENICEIGGLPVLGWHRLPLGAGKPACRIYLSAGIHGDEPAGPMAALSLLRENLWPNGAELFVVPCLNPAGFALNQRENASGVDLNRDYLTPQSTECRSHIAWLQRQPDFDYYFCLHEDWESLGFYLYEQNPDARPSLAKAMIEAAKNVCPVEESASIEGRPAAGGIIRPAVNPKDRPDWPEAFYLISHKSRQGYTLEAPSDFPLPARVEALVAAISAAVAGITRLTGLNS
jgi:protein MpaA